MPKTIALMIGVSFCLATQLCADDAASVRVMSFNVRFASAQDGENAWDKRRDFLVETIQAFRPDLLGTQETEAVQKDYLAGKLAGYEAFGVGRDDGVNKGEMMAVFFRSDRFEKLDGGHFWLSETPDAPGSKSWDSSLPRMVTWLKLRDQKSPGQPVVWLFNTHFDHKGPVARAQGGKLIHDRIASLGPDAAVVLTGDFNSPEGSPPYQNVFAQTQGGPLLQDTYRVAHPQRSDEEITYNNFHPDVRTGARIDWIGCTGQFAVESAAIDYTSRDGRVPSDHFPITAILKYSPR